MSWVRIPLPTPSDTGLSSSGKTQHFDCCIRRFESCQPSHIFFGGRIQKPKIKYDPLAQLAEHLTFNQGVRGSSLRWVTKNNPNSSHIGEWFGFLFMPNRFDIQLYSLSNKRRCCADVVSSAQNEDIPQVNPQLYKWLAIINKTSPPVPHYTTSQERCQW